MQFAYQARDLAGRVRDGEIVADTLDEAAKLVRREGLFLLKIIERGSSHDDRPLEIFQRRVTRQEIVYLTHQLAVMIDAGVPLSTALEGLVRQADNPTVREMLDQIHKDVAGGDDLSTALGRFPRRFDKTYVNLVKASETSGTLATMLERIATQTRADLETRMKIRGAMAYPAAMLVMCVGVCIFLLAYVFPKLTPMFEARSLALPMPTRVLMALSNSLLAHWGWYIGGAVLIVGGFLVFRKQKFGRTALDWMWIHLPILGPLLRKVALSRSLRTLATTLNAGVPMIESLKLAGAVSGNVLYERAWLVVADHVAGGKQIHQALDGHKLFPATLLQMIASGEGTGRLGPVTTRVSDYFDHEVATSVGTATRLIEPLMVFLMGGIIGTIALAMLLPIFKLSSHVH
ncbi:MAG: type II secretion system F family protein [Planctomycetaceae bacterium]